MYISCDALLAGRLIGSGAVTCDTYMKAYNFDFGQCRPSNITVKEKAYVYVKYYAEQYGRTPAQDREKFLRQPWDDLARAAFLSQWRCR